MSDRRRSGVGIDVIAREGTIIIRPHGGFDSATARIVDELVQTAMDEGARVVVELDRTDVATTRPKSDHDSA